MSMSKTTRRGAKPKPIKKNSKPNPRPPTDHQLDMKAMMLCKSFISLLSEHVSSARLVGTKVTPKGRTIRFSYGFGDLLSQMYSAEMFLDEAEGVLNGD